jgi:uncharacterized membrane protein YagU involved in acid resistance
MRYFWVMFAFLKRPYPRRTTVRETVFSSISYGGFTMVFLILFRPFLFGQAFQAGSQYLPALYYGIIVALCTLFTHLIELPLWRKHDEALWTVGKEIFSDILSFLVVAAGVWLFTVVKYDLPVTVSSFLQFVGMVIAIGLLPHTIFVLIKENRLLGKYRRAAEVAQRGLAGSALSMPAEAPVPVAAPVLPVSLPLVLTTENSRESLELAPQALLCIEGADNYIRIYCAGASPLLLRGSLKQAESDLKAHPVFFRCHRGYIVNLSKVVEVSGNAQGLRLRLEGLPEVLIPVSRALNKQVSDLLKKG